MTNWKNCISLTHLYWMRLRTKNCPEMKFQAARMLIIAPHPDDEVMGMGGVICRLTQLGYPPHIIILSKGELSHQGCCDTPNEVIKTTRCQLAISVMKSLGLPSDHLHILNFPDGKISAGDPEMQHLKTIIQTVSPQMVFIPHYGERWPDHIHAAEIVNTLLSPQVEIYEYCVWLWYYNVWRLNWKNARVLRMSLQEHQKKKQAVNDYVTPKAPCGKPWSGVLPKLLVDACTNDTELFFKVTRN